MNGQDTGSKVKCWDCEGLGYILLPFRPVPPLTMKCDRCEGDGICPEIMLEWQKDGEKRKQKRLAAGLTLRNAVIAWKIDVMVLSRAERGIINPIILNETGL